MLEPLDSSSAKTWQLGATTITVGERIQGELDELVAPQNEIAAALVGKRVSVADIFEFAAQLQQLYVRRVPT